MISSYHSSYDINNILDLFIKKYDNVRLIPQMHKFINVQ